MQREIDDRLDAGIMPIPQKGRDIGTEEFWQKYLEWARDHKRPNTIATEEGFWKQMIKITRIRTSIERSEPTTTGN